MTDDSQTGNPKDAIGSSKSPLSTLSRRVIHELGLAMLEGELQYWRHNYRASRVRAMVYVDAFDRHMSAWIEGQNIDPKSGLSHLVKAMACLMILRDAEIYGTLIDDRPPAQANPDWMEELNEKARTLIQKLSHLQRGSYAESNRGMWSSFARLLRNGPVAAGSKVEELPRDGLCNAVGRFGRFGRLGKPTVECSFPYGHEGVCSWRVKSNDG